MFQTTNQLCLKRLHTHVGWLTPMAPRGHLPCVPHIRWARGLLTWAEGTLRVAVVVGVYNSFIYIYVCMHVCMHVSKYVCMYVCK